MAGGGQPQELHGLQELRPSSLRPHSGKSLLKSCGLHMISAL
uniref:Uncharacterized protein n=1 Tax=Anguilla anguilla TaxID=7936 RepID=A0A0E9VPJ0_ANGAN